VSKLCAKAALAAMAVFSGTAQAQFTNADFETGDLTGWTVTLTPNGRTLFSLVEMFDIDGPAGSGGASHCGKFAVGKENFGLPGDGGIELTQEVQLTANTQYTFECDYAVFGPPPRTVGNAHGGRFALIVDGQVIADANVGSIEPNTWYGGHLSGNYQPPSNGAHTVGIRITRDFAPSPETIPLHQWVDNFAPDVPPCYPDCDTTTGVGVLDIFDFLCFQNRFDAGSSYACDCDTSTGVGVCDIFDFLCFQNAFDAGCP
jgi:hypothetical protein